MSFQNKSSIMDKIYNLAIILLMICLLTISRAFAQEAPSDDELLNMSLDELMDIQVVNVSKVNVENLSEVPSAITVITAEQIANSGAKNMEEVMRTVPGFDVIRSGSNASVSFGVRGLYSAEGTNNKILFLVDDHPVRSVFFGDATVFLGNFPIENIKQIEIIRGPGSTLFGAGAFLGVINIRTNKPEKNVDVSFTGGSFGRYNVNAQFAQKINEDFEISLLANHLRTDGFSQELNSDRAKETLDFVTTNLFNYTGPLSSATPGTTTFGRTSTNLNLRTDFKDFYLLANYMNSEDEIPVSQYEILVDESKTENMGQYLETGFRKMIIDDMGEVLVKAYVDQYNYRINTQVFSEQAVPTLNFLINGFYALDSELTGIPTFYQEGEAIVQQRKARNNIRGAEFNFAYNFQNYVNLLAGAMYEYHTLDNVGTYANGNLLIDQSINFNGRTYSGVEAFGGLQDINQDFSWISERSRSIYAGFGQVDLNFKNIFKTQGIEHFKLVAGVRYDGYSDVGGSLNPRLALLIAPNKNVYFKSLYGEAFRAPSFAELYTRNNAVDLGNENLEPEKIATLEVIGGYRIGDHFDANLTYFNTRVSENIQLIDDNNPSTFFAAVYTNIGDFRSRGLEGELSYTFKEGAYVSGSFTYQQVENVTEGDLITAFDFVNQVQLSSEQANFNPGRAPDFVINLTGNYPITKNINVNTSINYLDQRRRSEEKEYEIDNNLQPTGNIILADDREAIPARALWDAAITFGNFDFAKGLTLKVAGYNLLDDRNFNQLQFVRGDDLLLAGRHWGATIRYGF